ncbi:adenylyltransferase and sulfurtransferase MOCS3-like [Rhopilema esculentum]|uniref:adenylyltransferase and sulfurtransferase MOCS3-like n=1 Tax=Rhopilema esculentum TaxID=499914 RepID=UPI0031DF50F5
METSLESRTTKCSLSNDEISRYSRQLILPEIGVHGQTNLKNGRVLIVGMGGLGCPASLYLAAAGVGTLGLLDYDCVEINNLHRQTLHAEDTVGLSKVKSASKQIKRINSSVNCIEHHQSLDSKSAVQIIEGYDIVIDASDNVPTRYLVNDACVLTGKPLISGSALRFEGQLTTYNYENGPCYRCLYPKPPPAEAVTNCSDGGVIGAVTGFIGSLQALEAIKMLAGVGASYSRRLLMFDGLSGDIRTIKLRAKKEDCPVCGKEPTIKELEDYELFCGCSATDKTRSLDLLTPEERISAQGYKKVLDGGANHILIDVRPQNEFSICAFKNAENFPINSIEDGKMFKYIKEQLKMENKQVFVLCKQGNDSQKAVLAIKKELEEELSKDLVKDIVGGLLAWSTNVDNDFPIY